jgi:TPP-dependent pyruvate/acetoin dehydrogenase alpha subunit
VASDRATATEAVGGDLAVSMLRGALRIRLFEEALFRAFMAGNMPGTMHQAIGQEAVSVGVGHALREDDYMTSTHRGHGHAIAKGLPLDQMMAEMYAKSTGLSRGMGGSMHIFDLPRGFLGTTGVVGAGLPIAVGAALAVSLNGSDQVVAAFFGDGAANQGAVHEALNLAAVWQVPVVFVCENNQYAVSMPSHASMRIERVADRAAAYGIPGVTVDGNDAFAVHASATEAVARARAGGGPTLIECLTYRYKGHSRFEPGAYRPEGELEAWQARDPITLLEERAQQAGVIDPDGVAALRSQVQEEVDAAVAFAKSSPDIEPDAVMRWTFA